MTTSISNQMLLRQLPVVSLDLETTGLDVRNDRIVQVAVLELSLAECQGGTLLDTLVDPGIQISPRSSAIHGISNADVVDARRFIDLHQCICDTIENRLVIGHHIGFDLAVLQQESLRSGLAWQQPQSLDLAMLAAALQPGLPDHAIESVADWLGVDISARHTALGDSRAAATIFMKLLPIMASRGIDTLADAKTLISTRDDLIVQAHRAGWYQEAFKLAPSRQAWFQQEVDGLREIKQSQIEQTRRSLQEGVPAIDIQARIGATNIELHRAALELSIRDAIESDLGQPPVEFEAIIIGSGARGESFLHPDQDNGFILSDAIEVDRDAKDSWFESLAMRMTDTLAEIGFYHCPGWIMATNPRWRKSLTGFREQTTGWMREARGNALHYCNIFMDFRAFTDSAGMTDDLRDFIVEQARDQRFLSRLYDIHKNHTGALGMFGRIITDPNPGPNQGKIDLKTTGTLPIVTAVRILALYHGVRAQTTRERIDKLHRHGLLDEADALLAAYSLIVFLLLRQQLEDHRCAAPLGNYLPPSALSRGERAELLTAYQVIRRFCKLVAKTVRKPIEK